MSDSYYRGDSPRKMGRLTLYIFNYIQSISQFQINFIKILIFGLKVILKLKIY